MIKTFLIVFFLVLPGIHTISAQVRHDYVWILGYPPNKPDKFFGGVMLDFNIDIVEPNYFNIYYDAQVPAPLSTQSGRLLLYSNGCTIVAGDHHAMQGGDTIAYGYIWDNHCGTGLGYPGTQNNLALPWPGDTTRAAVIYKLTTEDFTSHILLYATVQFDEAHPEGRVVSKDLFLVDPGSSALITATRHANGRDWWLILPEDATNRFFLMLLDPEGISMVDTLSVGNPWEKREWASQAVFTPDGTKYIRFNPWKGLDIFDFDRCTGQFSNPIESGTFSDPVLVGGGAGVSADSRYLYVSNVRYLYQYDLTDPDILSTRIIIDTFDGYTNPFPTYFYQMTLAPDGKLYMFSNNGVKSIHIIHHPERRGRDCAFIQHAMELPAYANIGSPNIPFFRLGPLDGSACDTLGINNTPIADFRYEIDSISPYVVRFKDLSYFLPESWIWDFGQGMLSEERQPAAIDFGGPGTYPVCLTVSNQYGEHTFCRTVVLQDPVTSAGNILHHAGLKIYPNPANEFLYIDLSSADGDEVLGFYNAMGVMMHTVPLSVGITGIEIADWPSGVYFYTILKDRVRIHSGKVIKQ